MFLSTRIKKKWNSLYKAIVWALGLGIMIFSKFSWYGIAIFVLIAIWAYFSASSNRSKLKITYLFSSVVSFWLLFSQTNISDSFLSSVWLSIILILILSFFMFSLFGLFEDYFINENFVYKIINTVIFIFLFISLFTLVSPISLGLWGGILSIIVFLLFNEFLSFFNIAKKRRILTSLTVSFLSFELAWVITLLPLGILNGTALLTLFMCSTRDFLLIHFKGNLKSSFIFQQFTFLIVITIIILASSSWGL